MKNNTIRRDPFTGNWVIYSPQRGRRPGARPGKSIDEREKSASNCPFCAGRESDTPPSIAERTGGPGGQPWATRVFDNRFPAVAPEADAPDLPGLLASVAARGRHEVIVETPHHTRDLADMEPEELTVVLETYASRLRAVRAEEPSLHPVLFKNHGPKAGATLRHPHAQLIAVPVHPPALRSRERRSYAYFSRTGRCLACAVRKRELRDRARITMRDDWFTSFVPFAANVPYETMIIPRRHHADLSHSTPDEVASLARHLSCMARALRAELYDPDFNLLFFTPSPSYIDHASAHWYMVLRPRFASDAGFERSAGMHINASWPEENARLIRHALR